MLNLAAFRYRDMLFDSILPIACLLSTSVIAASVRFCTEVTVRRRRETELAVAHLQREAARRELQLQSEADSLRHSLDFAVEAARLGVHLDCTCYTCWKVVVEPLGLLGKSSSA